MSKVETIHHGYHLIIDRFIENAGIPRSIQIRISTFDNHHYHDELTLTEDQYAELKQFVREDTDEVICKPFSDTEIDKEFQPRFGGANEKYRDFYRSGWRAAFDYVNHILLSKKK